jgi:hypothetical protein
MTWYTDPEILSNPAIWVSVGAVGGLLIWVIDDILMFLAKRRFLKKVSAIMKDSQDD